MKSQCSNDCYNVIIVITCFWHEVGVNILSPKILTYPDTYQDTYPDTDTYRIPRKAMYPYQDTYHILLKILHSATYVHETRAAGPIQKRL